jgi:hypothetical protein
VRSRSREPCYHELLVSETVRWGGNTAAAGSRHLSSPWATQDGVKYHLRHRASNGTSTAARLAHNYFNLFGHMFAPKLTGVEYKHAVILEDDLLPAPDFLEFFEVRSPPPSQGAKPLSSG